MSTVRAPVRVDAWDPPLYVQPYCKLHRTYRTEVTSQVYNYIFWYWILDRVSALSE